MFENKTVRETCEELRTDCEYGLTYTEAAKRLQDEGANELKSARKKTKIESFFEQLNDPLIYGLLAAAAVSILLQEVSDAVIIIVVVLMNAFVGIIQEGKAQKALDSLKKLTSPHAIVIREGKEQQVPASSLVPGDIVCLDAGCQVPADMRLVSANNLKVEESALTGESLPIEKNAGFLPKERMQSSRKTAPIPLGDRKNMAYMSTIVTNGRGTGIVTSTGMNTEIGRIAALINDSQEEITPLQKRLGDLGKVLSILSLGLCAALFLIAVLQHRDMAEMLITAISLAVAAVPEGLPAVVTICLALSVTRMVKVHTIVRRLPSVETLGAVSVVCSDKTGTLTQNRMTVESCFIDQKIVGSRELSTSGHREFLQGMTLCNDAVQKDGSGIGDPTELALLNLANEYGIRREVLEREMPREKELPFDSGRKMMSTMHRKGSSNVTYTKGAPDVVLKRCSRILIRGNVTAMTETHRRQIQGAIEQMSSQALRTLAVAMRPGGSAPVERELTFIGMVGMRDPARPEAKGAVARFKQAGVTTVMITGDHVDTAYAIAKQLGIVERQEQCMTGEEVQNLPEQKFLRKLDDVRVFARVSPEHKVRIVKGFKDRGNIVAMTGDGVNDAPSLKSADVGIAMGMSGTDVARQASDIILTDDNFATIEKAIEEGRGVYENIRKTVIFLLSSNLGEIMTMFLAVLCNIASPLKSSHILWINLITDSLPALALGVDVNDGDSLMEEPPRKAKESLFANGGLACTCLYGLLIAGISLTAFFTVPYELLMSRGVPFSIANIALVLENHEILMRAQTYAFTVLGMCQLFHAVGMRDMHRSVFRMNHLENKWMIGAFVLGFALQISVTEIPILINAFGTVHLELHEWIRLTILAAFPILAHECMVFFQKPETDVCKTAKMESIRIDR